MRPKEVLFNLIRKAVHLPWLGSFIRWIFTHMSFVLPLNYLRKTDTLVAFYHPHPSYPIHILLVPLRAISGLDDLTTGDADFLTDLMECAKSLVKEFQLDQKGYRLILNGGSYQDIPQLHFHLISEAK